MDKDREKDMPGAWTHRQGKAVTRIVWTEHGFHGSWVLAVKSLLPEQIWWVLGSQ